MPPPDSLAYALLDLSLAGSLLLLPIFEQSELVDFAYEYVNPTAQLMLRLPARPTGTLLQLNPRTQETGVFHLYTQAFAAEQTSYFGIDYDGEGLDGYYQVAARRYKQWLLVSFTDTADRQRGATDVALRQSQAREQLALLESRHQQQQLRQVFEHAPMPLAFFRGSDYVVELANPALAELWGRPLAQVLGRPVFEALPDLRDQGFEEILAGVLRTGKPFRSQEVPAVMDRAALGLPALGYFNISYEAVDYAPGQPATSIIASAVEVTEQVLARQQVERLNLQLEAARAEAERERAQLHALLSQAPVAIGLFEGEQLRVSAINPLMAGVLGYAPAQLLGHPLFERAPELQGQGFDELMHRVQATQQPYIGQEVAATVQRQGELLRLYFNFVYQPLFNTQGQVTGIINVAVDVTEQVLARQQVEQLNAELEARVQARTQELAEQQGLLVKILTQVPAGVATLSGPEHRFTFFNAAYVALAGRHPQLGQTVAEVFPEVITQGFLYWLDQVYTTGEPFVGTDTPVGLQDPLTGQVQQRYIDFSYQPLHDGQGEIQGILAFIVDVTDKALTRRQNETMQTALLAAARHQAQQRQELYQIFEQTPVAIVLLREPSHRIDYYNPAFAEVFPPAAPWPADAPLRGHPLAKVYPRMREAGLVQLLDRVFTTGESQVVLEMPLAELQPGSPRFITFAYQPYYEQERVVGVAAFAYDATEQVLARQQVQQLNQELTATNQALQVTNARLTRTNTELDSFVYTASHDLKAPIANIEGLLNALREEIPTAVLTSPLVAQLLNFMQDGITRFQQTIGHLVGVTYLHSEEASEQVALAELVESVRLDLVPILTATSGQLLLDLHQCPGARMSARDGRSILFNLLSNAFKYRAPERAPLVQLRAHCTDQLLTLEVQDNGLGLSQAQQDKLFGLFRRLHHHVEGSGVGLYAVKKTVENAGGTISVASELGVGSTFTVLLPH